jgi:site-specific recombinase XerD
VNTIAPGFIETTAATALIRRLGEQHNVNEDASPKTLQRGQPASPHVFVSEPGAPMAPKSFHVLIQRLGERAGMAFAIHPHMLRHACGYELANRGHDNPVASGLAWPSQHSHTVRYTGLAPDLVQGFWRA